MAVPFDSQRAYLEERREEYGWAIRSGLDMIAGTDPQTILPGAKSIVVVIEPYFREAFLSDSAGRVREEIVAALEESG
ncbi:MAG: hypothetical protein KJ936_08885 [Proteobacteria bacterium]|nr:hypothetical protein [Pseudomonadota bacterium]MBU2227760.1 hypothetical protein [Pseudomonadota bacterium]MBU2260979.1 hypothetical protein [Pseudomonadota bacterium]